MPYPCSILPRSFPFPIARSDPGRESLRKVRCSTMGSKALRLVCIIVFTAAFPAAARRDTFKQEMRFGAEAAQRGLWREAAFRWGKILKNDPDNARVHNNLAVAYESRSEEHTSELQSQSNLVCRLLLEKKKNDRTASDDYDV